jgi:hypothetical protein
MAWLRQRAGCPAGPCHRGRGSLPCHPAGNTVVDQVRRRVQQATLGHRGHKRDPLYRIRRLLLTAPSSSPNTDGRGCGWVDRWGSDRRGRRGLAGQGTATCGLRRQWSGRRPHRWTASTAGRTASGRWRCPGLPARFGHRSPKSSPSMPPRAAPTGRPRRGHLAEAPDRKAARSSPFKQQPGQIGRR